MNEFTGTIIIAGAYLLLFIIGEVVYHVFKSNAEVSRKLVHSGSGMIGLFLPVLITNHWIILALCIGFTSILYLSLKFNFLKSINAVDRNSTGSILFPVVLYLCFLQYTLSQNLLFYYAPILVLAISDPLAALLGKKWPVGQFKIRSYPKSLMGSGAFLISAFATLYILLVNLTDYPAQTILLWVGITAIAATIIEAVSINGFDNVTVPLVVLLLLMAFMR